MLNESAFVRAVKTGTAGSSKEITFKKKVEELVGTPTFYIFIIDLNKLFFGSQADHPFNINILHLSLIHISEPTRLLSISYAVFCLKQKKKNN